MQRIILLGITCSILLFGCKPKQPVPEPDTKKKVSKKDSTHTVKRDLFGMALDSMKVTDREVKRNESLYLILDKLDFNPQEIYSITQEARNVIDLDNIRPGQRYRTYASADSGKGLSKMVWQPNALEYVVFDWQDSLEIYRASRPLTGKTVAASGEVENSLYQTVSKAGASQLLAYKMANIFAWQIDFFSLRDGDSFNVLYNQHFIDDQFIGIGEVLMAEFTHRGERFRAYKFTRGSADGYYTASGESVEKALLKAPFEYNQRISSGFSRNRYHPVSGERRPHYGTDYAAPHGTPVLSVGDGVVTRANYSRGEGNMIKISHNATYETAYMHLSDFAEGIEDGTTVSQGQVIGYVGNTGLSTGPHLHYSLYKNDQPVNSLAVDLPSSESVADSLMPAFKKVRDSLNQRLQKKQEPDTLSKTDNAITQAK